MSETPSPYVFVRDRLPIDLVDPNQPMARTNIRARGTMMEWYQLLHAVEFQCRQQHDQAHRHEVRDATSAGIWDAWLDNLPADMRAMHDCPTCRTFVEGFGGYFVRTFSGSLISLFWDPARVPGLYRPAVKAIEQLVLLRAPDATVVVPPPRPWGTLELASDFHGGGTSHFGIPASGERRKTIGGRVAAATP